MALYDSLIAIGIILALILIAASKITKQTIPDLLRGITDWMRDRKEDTEDSYLQIYS